MLNNNEKSTVRFQLIRALTGAYLAKHLEWLDASSESHRAYEEGARDAVAMACRNLDIQFKYVDNTARAMYRGIVEQSKTDATADQPQGDATK